ncbi:2-amino-4-hydroxy-6-hydroxymethyldihydropteridine diphosphokinase [Novosphingobium fluoreni]|uniref:2-amino-4-hydroxy-6-hydroxymethyldihydropteridine pyrophosphokinase n=1 Tax=Novosphingobium fluoreni TaxID=1391222 RepID=A0A7W6FXC5_9SPHN|nr:2-amino-4-hydroxy-6-hydroxymethyldihydropteridine diphosphokinase [Novosphingobium fluoreni]MBB3939108.1 2-amino-4-hydroxy-6-hydroxymethyldihydropteridine diphosphokinase [Novosphingobium fluoreni]
MARHRYLIALGSNMRHPRHGAPEAVLRAAFKALDRKRLTLEAASRIIASAPHGPSRRRYANAVAIVHTRLRPPRLLRRLQRLEARFGRRPGGMAWGARVLDLDIVLWSGGAFAQEDLVIPHPLFRTRDFVLRPAVQIAGKWRDPLSGLTLNHLNARLTRPRPALRAHPSRTQPRHGGP